MKRPALSTAALCIVFAFLLCCAVFTAATASGAEEDSDLTTRYDYGIMIDAGSSGTRTFLYKWKHREMDVRNDYSPLSHPVTQTDWSFKNSVALSDFADRPDAVGELLTTCLDFAREQLKKEKVSTEDYASVPIYLGATAGLRILTRQQRVEVMLETRKVFKASEFYFQDHFAKILSGEEEGFFGYLTVNYLNNTLFPAHPNQQLNSSLFGALDMGGASTQISFATQPGEDILEHYYSYTSPYNDRYELYTRSFLNYGMNEFYTRLNDAMTASATTPGEEVQVPCYQVGYKAEYKNSKTKLTITTIGSGDIAACDALIDELLYRNTPCLTDNCSVNGAYQPELPKDITFFAFSGFANVVPYYSDRDTTTNNNKYSYKDIVDISDNICKMNYQDFFAKYTNVAEKFRSRGCLSMLYYTRLLKAYQFTSYPNQSNIVIASQLEGTELSWTLGRMVYEANMLGYDRLTKKLPSAMTYFAAIGILALVVAVLLGLLMYTWKKSSALNHSLQLAVNTDRDDYAKLI